MFGQIKNLAFNMFGRRTTYRLGRAMYLHARGEIANDMTKNGEMLIQSSVLAAWTKSMDDGKGFVAFDVGANIGDWSASLLRQMEGQIIDGCVNLYAFEPVPSTAETLRANLPFNQPYLHIEELAFSSSSGKTEIYIAGPNAGTNSLYDDKISEEKQSVTISLTTATDFCESRNIEHVDLLKCDTEGHDMEVIRGAMPLLKDERISVLQFEYNHRWAYSRNFLRDVFVAVDSLPYKVTKLQADQVLVFDKWQPELEKFFEGNYALIHDDALSWFPSKPAGFDHFNTLTTI